MPWIDQRIYELRLICTVNSIKNALMGQLIETFFSSMSSPVDYFLYKYVKDVLQTLYNKNCL